MIDLDFPIAAHDQLQFLSENCMRRLESNVKVYWRPKDSNSPDRHYSTLRALRSPEFEADDKFKRDHLRMTIGAIPDSGERSATREQSGIL